MSRPPSQESLSPWFADTLGRDRDHGGFQHPRPQAFLVTANSHRTENIQFRPERDRCESLVTPGHRERPRSHPRVPPNSSRAGQAPRGKRYTGKIEERKEMSCWFAQEILVALTGDKGS